MKNNLRYQFKLFDGNGKRMFWEMGFYPILVNKVCPHCGAHPMLEVDIFHVISPYETNYQCPLCGCSFKPEEVIGVSNDDLTIETFSFDGERYTVLDEENLSSIAKGLRKAKNKKVRVLVEGDDQKEFVIPPKSRPITYTYEFLEEARESARILATPLKRRNIYVREDDMCSECPTCGGLLHEEANIIFNYCPWCTQKLNKDFSEDEE